MDSFTVVFKDSWILADSALNFKKESEVRDSLVITNLKNSFRIKDVHGKISLVKKNAISKEPYTFRKAAG